MHPQPGGQAPSQEGLQLGTSLDVKLTFQNLLVSIVSSSLVPCVQSEVYFGLFRCFDNVTGL